MKKYGLGTILFCFLCLSMIGCGVSKVQGDNEQESSITINKDGSVLNVLVEDFTQDYYSEDGLSSMIQASVDAYLSEQSDASISLSAVTRVLDDQSIRVEMQYDSADTYSEFNELFFYYGTVEEALNKGYLASRLFYSLKDDNILQISKNNVEDYAELHICITEENMNLYTFGDILYVDSDTTVHAKRMASFSDSGQNHIVIFK